MLSAVLDIDSGFVDDLAAKGMLFKSTRVLILIVPIKLVTAVMKHLQNSKKPM